MKIFFAAMESLYNNYNLSLAQIQNVFLSYYYKNNTERVLRAEFGHNKCFVIDSGAHTFFGMAGIVAVSTYDTSETANLPSYQEAVSYYDAYIEWLLEFKDYYSYAVELDLQEVYGKDFVLQYRDKLRAVGLMRKIITVMHTGDSFLDFKTMVDTSESRYVAVQGIRLGEKPLPYLQLIKYAYENDCKIHGFAFTRGRLLLQYPFYSVDSSSWSVSVRFGCIQVCNGLRMLTVQPTPENFIKYRFPIQYHNTQRASEHSKEKLEFGLQEYSKWARNLTALWESRGILWQD